MINMTSLGATFSHSIWIRDKYTVSKTFHDLRCENSDLMTKSTDHWEDIYIIYI